MSRRPASRIYPEYILIFSSGWADTFGQPHGRRIQLERSNDQTGARYGKDQGTCPHRLCRDARPPDAWQCVSGHVSGSRDRHDAAGRTVLVIRLLSPRQLAVTTSRTFSQYFLQPRRRRRSRLHVPHFRRSSGGLDLMIRLGRISRTTMGVPTLHYVETPDCQLPGNLFACPASGSSGRLDRPHPSLPVAQAIATFLGARGAMRSGISLRPPGNGGPAP